MSSLSEKIAELSKRRGFFFPTSESYGGVGGFQTFGPEGAELKRNIENSWRETFSTELGNREIEAPTIMQEDIFEASGHLEGFDDSLIECPNCHNSTRADHLVEDETDIDEAESFSLEKLEDLIKENNLKCPSCGESLTDIEVEEFNLMFETSIGPGSSQKGYLRPETAQGIFAEFPRIKEYERNKLPFAITQIGKAYRNEISPRKGLVRVREFTQAELEHFIDPDNNKPDLERISDVKLKLYPISEQEKDEGEYLNLTVKEAVDKQVVGSKWIAYYLGIAKEWFEDIGIDMDKFRFRQHLPDERSHYASDCWDAETNIGANKEDWLEITGFAYRGSYDLRKHAEYSDEKKGYQVYKEYDEPKVRKEKKVKPDMGYLGPKFGDQADLVKEKLDEKVEEHPDVFKSEKKVVVEIDGEEHDIPTNKCNFQEVEIEENGEHIYPHVIEPSFGIDRILYSILVHSYEEDNIDGEKRSVLKFNSEITPTEAAVFPLMNKDGLGEKAKKISKRLRDAGFSIKYDDKGNIGRRYRRQDEVGTPYCITIDYQTIEQEPHTVTIRERDSTEQERVKISNLEEELSSKLN